VTAAEAACARPIWAAAVVTVAAVVAGTDVSHLRDCA
jgi:hypothetical protein